MSKTKYSSCRQVAKMLGVKYVRVPAGAILAVRGMG